MEMVWLANKTLNIPYQPLDEIVYIPYKSNPWGNLKRQFQKVHCFHILMQFIYHMNREYKNQMLKFIKVA
jgi:hypothetical protein